MAPESGMLMQPATVNYLIDTVPPAVSTIFPEAVHLNLFISTRPDMNEFESASTMELDGLTIKLGMNRDEIKTMLDGSKWSVFSDMHDQWGLTAGWPKTAEVYFENSEDDAKAVFFVPKFSGSSGGMNVISANMTLHPATELTAETP
jgi:hypothetical protein